jgi:hypothetical protein
MKQPPQREPAAVAERFPQMQDQFIAAALLLF